MKSKTVINCISYVIMNDHSRAFLNKGGLFTEFSNKNKAIIEMKKFERQKRKVLEEEKAKPEEKTNKEASKDSFKSKYKIKRNAKEVSPVISKAKEVIENKRLYKIKRFLENQQVR